jgi:hypothetical protein
MPSTPTRVLKPGKVFAEELAKLELKRIEAADLFGVDSSTITYWARRGVGKNYVANVADVLGVPPEDIIGRGNKGRSKVTTVPVKAKSVASTNAPRLRPELIVELARTPLSDEQADLLRIIINSYGEAA